jgi:hypothetical protein
MKKFNNTLAGTDCGDAGLPGRSCDMPKAKTALRVVPKASDGTSRTLRVTAELNQQREQERQHMAKVRAAAT